MHVHITYAGKDPEPAINTVNAIGGIDRVSVLYSKTEDNQYKKTAETIREKLEGSGRECEMRGIESFNFLNIVDTIYNIYEECIEKYHDVKFSVNITNGTNLMSAAACTTAFFTGADVYYMMQRMCPGQSLENSLVRIDSPKIPDVKRLKSTSLDILRHIAEEQDCGREVTNSSIAAHFEMKPQATMYHVRRLEDAGLIETENGITSKGTVDRRRKLLKIKREGRFVLRWV